LIAGKPLIDGELLVAGKRLKMGMKWKNHPPRLRVVAWVLRYG